jgi:hypothetical protein
MDKRDRAFINLDAFTIRVVRDTYRQPRPYRAACDDCGRRRQVETTTLGPGVEADLCRECAATYTKES